MKLLNRLFQNIRHRIQIEKPAIQTAEDDQLWQDIRRLAKTIPGEPEPNLGRVYEIKEELKKGIYPTQEMIDMAAARLAARLLRETPFDPQ